MHALESPPVPQEKSSSLDVSCVILTWNSLEFLDRLFGSLEGAFNASGLRREYIVIDNGSTDGSLEAMARLRESGLPLTVVPLGSNTGTTFSRNVGLRIAKGNYVAILDSDIEVQQENSFELLLDRLKNQERAGIVSPRLQFASGNYQKSADSFPTLGRKIARYFYLRSIERREAESSFGNCVRAQEVDYTCSAFWLFSRELITRVGLLDEKIFYAPEDVDYCLRTWLSGRTVLIDGAVTVIHHAQEISRKGVFSKSLWLHAFGLLYFFRKHRFVLSSKRVQRRIDQIMNDQSTQEPNLI